LMSAQVDEEAESLLTYRTKQPTPLPWFQFSLVLFLQLAEPLTANVISPFAPELIRDLGITHGNESQVGYYVGVLTSLFFLTEACTVLYWSRTSDHVGRKPVILTGLFGLSLSMYCFGMSRTFWGLVLSRSLSGALNGNIGVIKSMVAEITDSTNISTAYAYMPIAWNTGGTLGPMIGGWLSRPVERFPQLFGGNEFLEKYPYFLACAVPATFSAVAWIVTFLFLEETVQSPTPIAQHLGFKAKSSGPTKERCSFEDEDTPFIGSSISMAKFGQTTDDRPKMKTSLPIRSLLTARVIIAAGNYASLAFVEICFRAIQPLFFSTPVHLGGLGMPPSTIGNILASFGILNGALQALYFARMNDRWGSKNVFMWGLATLVLATATFPLLSFLVQKTGHGPLLWIGIALQVVISVPVCFCYGAVFIYISNASPNRASIGATNGLSQMTVSVMRAMGPAAATSLYSFSIEKGYLSGHLVYYVLTAFVGIALYIGSLLPRQVWSD
ncbi:hypothetical protein GALMADRAFT_64308, partial [Galerina marginata CBS 339.88]